MPRAILVCVVAMSVWSSAARAEVALPAPIAPCEGEECARLNEARAERDVAHVIIASSSALGALVVSGSFFVGPVGEPLWYVPGVVSKTLAGGDSGGTLLMLALVAPGFGSVVGGVLGVLAAGAVNGDLKLITVGPPLALGLGVAATSAVILAVVGAVGLVTVVGKNPVGAAAVGVFAIAGGGLLLISSPLLTAVAGGAATTITYDILTPLETVAE